ncbi:tRNA (adenosine(37)-N6)-dimethylallyltransferase MiaA [bacterium]|nr:tRNA (adenosine(37)-N6)-dimethylallyltransferase MiaA [bacterium]
MPKDITIVIGPTAIGKSDFAIAKALETSAEIISADAFQVYKGMDIGTAKVSSEIRSEIPHHLIDIKCPDEEYSVADFMQLSEKIIASLRQQHKPIIICGGTGFYINAFMRGFEFPDVKQNSQIRKELQEKALVHGNVSLWDQLQQIDPVSAAALEPNDQKRIIRALEIYYQTNVVPSSLKKRAANIRPDIHIIGLNAPREIIYDKINIRVDQMYQNGLIEEVETLLKKYEESLNAFEAIGYKETIQYLKGRISKQEMIELVKRKTRNFAKRQLTWYRRFENVQWLETI